MSHSPTCLPCCFLLHPQCPVCSCCRPMSLITLYVIVANQPPLRLVFSFHPPTAVNSELLYSIPFHFIQSVCWFNVLFLGFLLPSPAPGYIILFTQTYLQIIIQSLHFFKFISEFRNQKRNIFWLNHIYFFKKNPHVKSSFH